MDDQAHHIVRVFNNNAVLVRNNDSEHIIVGRGIGFGRRPGDSIEHGEAHRHYVEVSAQRIQFLKQAQNLPEQALDAISGGIELAADILGELHPSVYLLLSDHLIFAMQRLHDGQVIRNNLMTEIRAVFPEEFAAAEAVLTYINTHSGIILPADEAAFIALHLNAARSGVTVKQPLEQANRLATIINDAGQSLGIVREVPEEVSASILATMRRIESGMFRKNDALRAISRDLPQEFDVAQRIIAQLLQVDAVPLLALGEVAFLSVTLHAWRQSDGVIHPFKQKESQ
ncbi:PRD domain-containing protein [Arcanobacterium bovis]|uniref:PRD domain-containing protein n=1 Tax=Arcanobacterium bovis TaxID=2529275 RepID=A0A4Q9V0E9_9ACTO|nr:PRD domain-containing protein [Arcanobacterium bovis]TBW22133.1 PRD domain-containing protein [Arcanobacterium bovis]